MRACSSPVSKLSLMGCSQNEGRRCEPQVHGWIGDWILLWVLTVVNDGRDSWPRESHSAASLDRLVFACYGGEASCRASQRQTGN